MRILFLTESSPAIGSGHVMRSIALAKALRQLGHEAAFYGKPLCDWGRLTVSSRGFQVFERHLEAEAKRSDLAILDGYHYGASFMDTLRLLTRLAVIEDFLHRAVRTDILIDPNIGGEKSFFEQDHIEFDHYIGGSGFLALSDLVTKDSPRNPNDKPESLLISFGGSDPSFASENVLSQILNSAHQFERVALVIGPMFEDARRKELQERVGKSKIELLGPFNTLGPLYHDFRWAIGAGGTSAYERVFHLIPSLNLITHSNQERIANKLFELGLAISWDARQGDYSGIATSLAAVLDPKTEARLREFHVQIKDNGASNLAAALHSHIVG